MDSPPAGFMIRVFRPVDLSLGCTREPTEVLKNTGAWTKKKQKKKMIFEDHLQ